MLGDLQDFYSRDYPEVGNKRINSLGSSALIISCIARLAFILVTAILIKIVVFPDYVIGRGWEIACITILAQASVITFVFGVFQHSNTKDTMYDLIYFVNYVLIDTGNIKPKDFFLSFRPRWISAYLHVVEYRHSSIRSMCIVLFSLSSMGVILLVHSILPSFIVSILTPFLLIVSLFGPRMLQTDPGFINHLNEFLDHNKGMHERNAAQEANGRSWYSNPTKTWRNKQGQ